MDPANLRDMLRARRIQRTSAPMWETGRRASNVAVPLLRDYPQRLARAKFSAVAAGFFTAIG